MHAIIDAARVHNETLRFFAPANTAAIARWAASWPVVASEVTDGSSLSHERIERREEPVQRRRIVTIRSGLRGEKRHRANILFQKARKAKNVESLPDAHPGLFEGETVTTTNPMTKLTRVRVAASNSTGVSPLDVGEAERLLPRHPAMRDGNIEAETRAARGSAR